VDLALMPWSPSDAKSHTSKARNPKLARQWADIANNALKRSGNDASAIRQANGVIAHEVAKRHKKAAKK
jgi:hypothetical protein